MASMAGKPCCGAKCAFGRGDCKVDIGGFMVRFDPQRRSGTYVTQSMMTVDGRLIG